ncbi:MAG: sensor histidine kinase [Arenimonas sp.]
MKTRIYFFARIVLAWFLVSIAINVFLNATGLDYLLWLFNLISWVTLVLLMIAGAVHLNRVRLITDDVDAGKLRNRHHRQIEIPFEAETALPMLEASIRELPCNEDIKITRDGQRMRVKVQPIDLENEGTSLWKKLYLNFGAAKYNQVIADIASSNGTVSVNLMCEPEGAEWADWLFLDEGTNLQNAETVTRAISRRISEHRRGEQASTKETVTEKELAVAKLNLLHAQVEPHFLYNTLGSAKYLISSDPVRAEAMLDNLILYLRHSLPRGEDAPSTLGEEVERTRAYLDILKIRMGERLQVSVEVPQELLAVPFPTMMLQTLVENSINHGLEPKSGGGTIWISARADNTSKDNLITVTVADDGNGFGSGTSGTGIGLKNVRERLKLAYGNVAAFSIVTNFPNGVAASITVPASGPQGAA